MGSRMVRRVRRRGWELAGMVGWFVVRYLKLRLGKGLAKELAAKLGRRAAFKLEGR